jgi:hypothetical protein
MNLIEKVNPYYPEHNFNFSKEEWEGRYCSANERNPLLLYINNIIRNTFIDIQDTAKCLENSTFTNNNKGIKVNLRKDFLRFFINPNVYVDLNHLKNIYMSDENISYDTYYKYIIHYIKLFYASEREVYLEMAYTEFYRSI